jgi:AcrR family transcriptional regulator
MTAADTPRGRRLSPEARRRQILDVARELFAEQPFTQVSTADVADRAGVARSLVHHYFGGIRELFLAVAREGVDALNGAPRKGPEAPLDERLAHNVAAGMDLIGAHRQLWVAVVGQASAFGDPELAAILDALNAESIDQALLNVDVVEDTPRARFALRCLQQLIVEALRGWLSGEVEREDAERLITLALGAFLTDVIPAFQR